MNLPYALDSFPIRERFTDAFSPGGMPVYKDRHIGAQLQTEVLQPLFPEATAPQLIQCDQGGRRIRAAATQSTASAGTIEVRTPWMELDDVFYEARGATWALLHILKAAEQDFGPILRKKNALVSLRQIIRELEETQGPTFSPVILNGSGFGLFANYSLTMANLPTRFRHSL